MRLSRNRNWGHPKLVSFLERLAARRRKPAGTGCWSATCRSRAAGRCSPAMPAIRSGSTPTSGSRRCRTANCRAAGARNDVGHGSGARRPARHRSEGMDARRHRGDPHRGARIREVERIFVNAAIKKALCREAGKDRNWLTKVRPWWGHDYHFHVRIVCPAGQPDLQAAADAGIGRRLRPRTRLLVHGNGICTRSRQPSRRSRRPQLTMAGLPAACRQVLTAP